MSETTTTPATNLAPTTQQRIVLAEDDHVLQDMYQERLKAAGFDVTLATDGEQALADITTTNPDLVILDIMMPKMNGLDVLKELKSKDSTKKIPVIVATALVQDMTEIKSLLTPNDAYLIKSEVMPGDVVKLVQAKLSGSTAQTVTPDQTAA